MTLVAHYTKNPETVYHNVHFDFNGGEVDDTGRWDYLDSYDVLVADGDLFNNVILGCRQQTGSAVDIQPGRKGVQRLARRGRKAVSGDGCRYFRSVPYS